MWFAFRVELLLLRKHRWSSEAEAGARGIGGPNRGDGICHGTSREAWVVAEGPTWSAAYHIFGRDTTSNVNSGTRVSGCFVTDRKQKVTAERRGDWEAGVFQQKSPGWTQHPGTDAA